jgi:phosphoserine phosphatase RsbX
MEELTPALPIEWGVATFTPAEQTVSGDQYVVHPFPHGVLVAVIDGLGHGQEAAVASKIAVATLEVYAHESVIALVRHCHKALTQTRGAVMSLASFNRVDETMTWLGIGNVAAVLCRADPSVGPQREDLLLRGGGVGYQLPPLSAAVIPVMAGDILVLGTDGLKNDFADAIVTGEPPQRLADRILAQYGKGTDDALVLAARWHGLGATTLPGTAGSR